MTNSQGQKIWGSKGHESTKGFIYTVFDAGCEIEAKAFIYETFGSSLVKRIRYYSHDTSRSSRTFSVDINPKPEGQEIPAKPVFCHKTQTCRATPEEKAFLLSKDFSPVSPSLKGQGVACDTFDENFGSKGLRFIRTDYSWEVWRVEGSSRTLMAGSLLSLGGQDSPF